ncbi:MAG TPA: glycosyltransferase family 4 protein [Promineifilum sp.]|nr:glycosyltransferase family 4 protein [Promineifilum sp.]
MHILLMQLYSPHPTPDYDQIAFGLREHGNTVWIGTPNVDGAIEWYDGDRIVAAQRTDRAIASGRKARLDLFRQVRSFVREVRPDIVQINSYNLFRLTPLGMPRPPRFIFDLRQINEFQGSTFAGKIEARLRNHSRHYDPRYIFDRTTFLHEAGARQVLGDDWRRWATVVPMGVDPQFLAAERTGISAADGDRPVEFIYSGRLNHIRKLERIIEAADRVRQHSEQFRITFMGYDETNGYYTGLIQQSNLEHLVHIRPPVPYDEVPNTLLDYDVALAYVPETPLDWQYHPTLKVLEYSALGLPIIATDFEPNRDLVEQGVNGLLVPNSVGDIAQAMLRFIQDPAFLARCRVNAEAKRGGVTWDQVSLQYMELYHQLMEK